MKRTALLLSLVPCIAPGATALASPIDVSAEVETPVGARHVVLGDSCRFGVVPRIMITRPPVNGALRVQTEVARIPDSDPLCAGKMSRAAVIYYKSVGGYHGPDSFSYEQVPDAGKITEVQIEVR